MEYMVLIVHPKRPPTGEPATMQEMGKFAAELVGAGKMRGGAPLHPEEQGVRLRLGDTGRVVTDGPFAESKEVVGGFFVLEAASREEAIELAKRCPHVRAGIAEVRVLPDRDVNRRAEGKSFLFLLHMEPDLTDPDGSGYRQMVAYDEVLKKEGRYLESSQLGSDPPGARIETRGGKAVVTDGPFAESKEVVGGYYLVEAPSLDDAVELAARCPHARWGTIEVREIMKVDPI